MDLRSIVNNDEGVPNPLRSSSSAAPARGPVTPVQSSNTLNDSAYPSHPAAYSSQDYRQSRASPSLLHHHSSATEHYQPRASPLSHQISLGNGPLPTPSHYPPNLNTTDTQSLRRHTPSASVGTAYPFPQDHISASPGQYQQQQQHQQHQPSLPRSDSFPSSGSNFFQPPALLTHQTTHSSYSQPSPQTPTSNILNYQSPRNTHTYPPQHRPSAQHSHQPSQPATPLGPPALPRQSSNNYQYPPSPHQQRHSTEHYTSHPPTRASPAQAQNPAAHYPQQRLPSVSSAYGSHRGSLDEARVSISSRARSSSVSPKTRVEYLPSMESMEAPQSTVAMQYPPAQLQQSYPPQIQNEMIIQNHTLLTQHDLPRVSSSPKQLVAQSSLSANGPATLHNNKRKLDDRDSSEPSSEGHINPNYSQEQGSLHQPVAKKQRTRYTAPPIWAQSVLTKKGKRYKAQPASQPSQLATEPANGSVLETHTPAQANTVAGPVSAAKISGLKSDQELLGPWEPSFSGVVPIQGFTKHVADWLFTTVVTRSDYGEMKSRGVEIEIEAKLGTFVDRERNERIYYPVQNECILSATRNETERRAFKSSMTESQHRFMNNWLNTAVQKAYPKDPTSHARIPIVYKHRRERDSFYELPASQHSLLPSSIRELKGRHDCSVRVTRDQKTGEVLAAIIKSRVSDLDLYLPSEPLDCRISVNLEMRYDGDLEGLGSTSRADPRPERNKDRLSYQQGPYTADLTQVTMVNSQEHELELELDTNALMIQGRRALIGEEHRFTEIVDGFLNNIRLLARNVPREG